MFSARNPRGSPPSTPRRDSPTKTANFTRESPGRNPAAIPPMTIPGRMKSFRRRKAGISTKKPTPCGFYPFGAVSDAALSVFSPASSLLPGRHLPQDEIGAAEIAILIQILLQITYLVIPGGLGVIVGKKTLQTKLSVSPIPHDVVILFEDV